MDICGPYPIATPSGKHYFHSILDDCSNFGFTALLRAHRALRFYMDTETYLEHASGLLVKAVRLMVLLNFLQVPWVLTSRLVALLFK